MTDPEKNTISREAKNKDIQEKVRLAAKIFEKYGNEIRAMIHFNTKDKSKTDDIFQNFFLSTVRNPIPSDIEDVKAIQLQVLLAAVSRIREVDPTARVNPQIVGAVELLALVRCRTHGHFTIGRDGRNSAVAALAYHQISFAIKVEPIGTAGIIAECRQFSVDRPFVDPLVGNIGEVDVPLRVAGRPFGELEPTGELLDFHPGLHKVLGPSGGHTNTSNAQ